MGKIIASNSLRHLASLLADKINSSEKKLFSKTVFITQSAGMNAWLKTEIAKQKGVLANFSFLNQDGLFNEIYHIIYGEKLMNNVNNLKHKIYELLKDSTFCELFPDTANYYKANDHKRIQLAGKLSDLFDQYQLYRPDMISKWDKGDLITNSADNALRYNIEKWQQWLWKHLNIKSKQDTKDQIMQEIEKHSEAIKKKIPEINVFGISIFTEFHHSFIQTLSKYVDVNIFISLPTKDSFYQNDLLKSLGSKALELAELNEGYEFASIPYNADNYLGRLQNQILNNENAEVPDPDDSLQINSCYSPAREAECLYNFLLDQFSTHGSELKPEDVLVMAGDINTYAPYIKAVFKNAPLSIPFEITGAAASIEDSMTSALERILSMDEEDLTAEKVLGLLEHNRIKSRFGIESSEYLRESIRKANIRFGPKNDPDDDTIYVSWDYGLKKLALGYAMLSEEPYSLSGELTIFPFKDSEAAQSYDLFRLTAFVNNLQKLIDDRKTQRKLVDWNEWLLNDVFENMIYIDSFKKDDAEERNAIFKAMSFINKLEHDLPVSFAVFQDTLNCNLFIESSDFKMNSGRVTISSPAPVRGLPYKIICFIGLNNDIFPRRDSRLGFDLIKEDDLTKETRRGDRNKTETDKLLFLETLLAAEEKLYLSFIGQSIKDNNDIPMSTVTDSLYDYLGSETVLRKHPLHGFSSKYNKDEKSIFTYLYNESPKEFTPAENPQPELQEISLTDFVKFFEHPIEWYFNNKLGIKYRDDSDSLPETEHFELNKLEEWIIKNDLIRTPPDEDEAYLAKAIKEGKLPLKALGEYTRNKISGEISEIRSAFQASSPSADESTEAISMNADDFRISGKIGNIYSGRYVAYAFSNNLKYQIRAYLESLLLYRAGKINSAEFLYLSKEWGKVIFHRVTFPTENTASIDERIKSLMSFFRKGIRSPLLFSPAAASKIISGENTENIFLKEAYGDKYADKPANKYVLSLWKQDYFSHFTLENYDEADFDKEVYNENPVFEEIKEINRLLNLKNEKDEE